MSEQDLALIVGTKYNKWRGIGKVVFLLLLLRGGRFM
jgi:hypothetical protein